MNTRSGSQRRHHPASPFQAQPERQIEQFAVQDRVTHDRFGLGRVISAEEAAVTVDFAGREVRIVSPYDKLTKL